MMTLLAPETLDGADFSTYRIGGPIQQAYQPASMAAVTELLDQVAGSDAPLSVLGWGGNTLIASAGISGVTLITRKMRWLERLDDCRFRAAAGVHLARMAAEAQKAGLSGAEFMIGIPGTIGGALRMNAGAMGQETAPLVVSVTLFNRASGRIETWPADELGYAYRKSAINPRQQIILEAELLFSPADADAIAARMAQSITFRKTHHPTEPNGGSVFWNPSKEQPAGLLLDRLGAKTWVEGGVRISPLHANFIVNLGHGTSTDVLRLMARMKRAIAEHYGLSVQPENLFVGDATDEEAQLWQYLTTPTPCLSGDPSP